MPVLSRLLALMSGRSIRCFRAKLAAGEARTTGCARLPRVIGAAPYMRAGSLRTGLRFQTESFSSMSTQLLLTQAAGSGSGAAGFLMLVPYLLIFVVFWFFLIRPAPLPEHGSLAQPIQRRTTEQGEARREMSAGNILKLRDIEARILPEQELETYGTDDSRLPMSGMAAYTPGMEITGGSLGQGLIIGVGMALGLKQKKNPAFVYNSMSDGELDEGSTWEAAMSAAHHQLDNLICLVDINNQQADGPSSKVLGFEPLADKWAAFGWHVQRVDGNDLAAVLAAFDTARHLTEPKPRVILFNTLMGKGVPFLETRDKNHFIRVDPPEWQQALAILDQTDPAGAAA